MLETPVSDTTLSEEGGFADAKAVGDKFAKVDSETASLKEDITTDKVNTKIAANNKIVKNNLTHGLFINAFGENKTAMRQILLKIYQ